ncbi:hypothetical protein I4Q36_02085 [Tuanshanicoccus lijuaniae]|nr:hypothetical protein I4Q36_02085 [Aerococcaceae bacterium zg-1292]
MMKFETIEQAFNYWNGKTLKEIEERSKVIKQEVSNNVDVDIEAFNIEVEGMKQAKENFIEKRSAILNFNPITGNQTKKEENNMTVTDTASTVEYRNAFLKD